MPRATDPRPTSAPRSRRLGLLAVLLVPLLLVLQAPLLAAVVPGALITVASLDALAGRSHAAAARPSAALLAGDDVVEQRRLAAATPIAAVHRRVG